MPVWVRAALLVSIGSGPAPVSHPLHSALAEIEYQAESGSVLIRVRAFRDDLAAATSSSGDSLPADSVLSRYVRETLALSDSNGRLGTAWAAVVKAMGDDGGPLAHVAMKTTGDAAASPPATICSASSAVVIRPTATVRIPASVLIRLANGV